jgi:hypothetical protein
MNISPVRCPTVPLPGEAIVIAPGLAFAAATSPGNVVNGDFGEATSTSGVEATSATGVRSLSGSYPSFDSAGLIARLLVCPSTSV